jgi:hypothetical protein
MKPPERAQPTIAAATSPAPAIDDELAPTGLKALFINHTLTRSPQVSNAQTLVDASRSMMDRQAITTSTFVSSTMTSQPVSIRTRPPKLGSRRLTFHSIHGVLSRPGLGRADMAGRHSSAMPRGIERLYATSQVLNQAGRSRCYGWVAGCLIIGNQDGMKHWAMNILDSLQHPGYTIPLQADAGRVGEAGSGSSYCDPGFCRQQNEFTTATPP